MADDWSLLFGLSSAFGPNATGRANRSEIYGTDLYLKYRPITRQSTTSVGWQTEVFYRRRQVPGDVLHDLSLYSQVAWRFARRWATALRYEFGSPETSVDGGLTEQREWMVDPGWVDSRHRVSVSISHFPTEFSRLRLQAAQDRPGSRDPIYALFLAAELVAGAHGSHTF